MPPDPVVKLQARRTGGKMSSSMETQLPILLTEQRSVHSELDELYGRIHQYASSKLWHQLTLAIEELSKAPCFAPPGNQELLELYKVFVADQPPNSLWTGFASRMNPLKHASFAIVVSKQFGDEEAGIAGSIKFLEEVGAKLSGDKEAFLLVRMEVARRSLQKGDVETCKKIVEECAEVVKDFAEVDASVNSAFYLVSSLLQKTLGDAGEFYKNSLLYLAFTPIETLSVSQRQALAYDLGLAALCGEKQYQFGELLLHPILQSLQGTPAQWLIEMLNAFNAGDIAAFESVSKTHGAAIQAEPTLVRNSQQLREKIRIFALMQLVREMPAHSRTLPFADIAARSALPEDEVELLLMRSLSLGLIKGSINQVDGNVRVTWVQPRVMDREALGKQAGKLKDWMDKVQRTSIFLANETPEILA